jgi:hypothetical protein
MIQSVNEKVILVVLVVLALSNLVFFVVSSYSGPIVGFIVAAAPAPFSRKYLTFQVAKT